MAGFSWDNYEPVQVAKHEDDKFSWDSFPTEGEDPSKSAVTAATTGLIEGAVPFAGALAGAGKAAMDTITGVRGPLAGGSLGDIADDYRQARDSFSNDAKKSAEANPTTALAGNLVGGLANPLFKGEMSLPKIGAASGVQALGSSDADLTKGEFKDAAIDTAVGAGLGTTVGYGLGKVAPKLWEGTKYFGKKALTNFGPSGEAIEARLAGKAQDTARSYPELAEDMRDTLKGLGEKTRELGEVAAQHLSSEPAIPKLTVTDIVDQSIKDLGLQGKTIGATDKQASGALNALKEDLSQLSDNLSEKDVKSLIRKMDDNINWDDQSQNKLNTILSGIRTQFDQSLKFRNPGYKEAMKPVAERTRLMENLRRQFSFKNIAGEGLQPTDTTASKIQSSLKENKAVTQKDLGKLKKLTGQDYSALADDYRLANQFQPKSPSASSKKTNIGGATGAAIGSLAAGPLGAGVGAGLGSHVGGAMDAYGGKVAGKLIDSYLKAGNSEAFGKFAPIIKKAADRGPQALAVLGSLLGSDPEFKKQMGIE